MSDSGEEKKGLSFGAIAFWVVLACVIGYFVVPGILNPPKDPLLEGLTDPEKALRTYQNTAYGFTKQTPGCGFMEVEKIVPVSDWAWYEANYQDIKKYDIVGSMRDGVLDAIDPTQGAAIDRRVGLSVAILAGCYSPGSEIISRDIRETEAFFVCRTRDIETETQTDWKVRVIKDGKFWKVSGFALGIANLTGSAQPGDIITAQLDRTAAKRKQVAEDMGMPETASPASKSPAFPSASTDNAGDSGGSALDLLGSADGGSGDSALDLLAGGEEDAELVSDGGSDPFGGNASTAEDSTKMVSSPKPAATESTKAEADVQALNQGLMRNPAMRRIHLPV